MSVRRITALTAAGLLAAALPIGAATTAEARPTADATVSILHAVPGATVDVYANGKALLTNFEPGTLTDPLKLPEGEYDLKVTAAGAGANGAAVIQANDVAVPGGANVTVVAHLNAGGKPALTPFVNDVSKLGAGKARLTVRHTAAAPAVDVRAGGDPVFEGLTNPQQVKADLPAGTVTADVVLAGTSTVAIGPADVNLKEGTNTVVYAWGSASGKNLKLAVQTISGLHGNPSGVPGGTGGQAAQSTQEQGLPLWAVLFCGAAALGLVGVGTSAVRARS
ncbi:hypothetical protein Kfla_4449 [Kribbella flavida DSM 17836]|uniref:DUF4397 domain-containing protein n=1 Tax=Kribbella flavida (strain DSM 17836 / JCM 10339 / NBRC 14399) TaxID=479435 RepID=D2PWL1_KRIFD|nr:DUF4397 domain-containing protein [Kribbella flavida]ADB33480.1 hypothetical protein Kfla_4449 [Kribbella flavida DSM 17836]